MSCFVFGEALVCFGVSCPEPTEEVQTNEWCGFPSTLLQEPGVQIPKLVLQIANEGLPEKSFSGLSAVSVPRRLADSSPHFGSLFAWWLAHNASGQATRKLPGAQKRAKELLGAGQSGIEGTLRP